ncbi:NDP-sugar synthase [Candidatus Roizmanbacteria bacterium]|nr:NDP-sugar synthase [Candidatus Roizmanbacteria bacterium]
MREVQAVLLAGGYGGRLEALAKDRQKCILPIDGKPAVIHTIENLLNAFGSVDLKIAVGFKAEQVRETVEKGGFSKLSITYVPHKPGTEGWGIYKDMDSHIKGPFIGMPGDIIAFPEAYEKVFQLFIDSDADAAMSLSPDLDVVDTHGIGKIKGGEVIELEWPPPHMIEESHLRDMTIWASDRRMFDMIRQYPSPYKSIGYVFMKAVRDKRQIAGNYYDNPWVHLGTVTDLNKHFV